MTDTTRVDRSVLGGVSDGLVITGDKNRVVVSLDGSSAPVVRVSRPWWRSRAERLLFGVPEPVVAGDRPLSWLRTDAGVIRVRPRPEDESLRAWCDGGPLRVRLVCGRGGQGKTTTAGQLVAGLRRAGWLAGFVDLAAVSSGEVESEAVRRRWAELAAALGSGPVRRGQVLLVVDYAENEPLVVRRLLGLVRDVPSVRVLLLSRGEGDWWSGLVSDPAWSRLVDPEVVRLRSIADALTGEQVAEVWADAVQRFADRAGTVVPIGRWRRGLRRGPTGFPTRTSSSWPATRLRMRTGATSYWLCAAPTMSSTPPASPWFWRGV